MAVAAASSRLSVGSAVAFVTGNVCGSAGAALMSTASVNPSTFPRGGRGNAHERCRGPFLNTFRSGTAVEAAHLGAASAHFRTFLGGRGGRGNAHERCFGPSLHIPRGNVNSDSYYALLTMYYLLCTTY